ncbi:hypothetical protein [Acanthopleuribacter pedis]|uniref:Uncharacterized protein n=1 Tax=Acanthopleuribacter pedis TaxID=442870 RepID=A0A8J7Q348_9BACT|nr:hypothetical protein [Acanthopleuribacter pedis]MBO1318375.1 hypothetical protein [Acanthopleuribacter pedis]
MDHLMRLAKAWLFIGMFLCLMVYPALLIQTSAPPGETAPAATRPPAHDRQPDAPSPLAAQPEAPAESAGQAEPYPTSTTVEEAVELEDFPTSPQNETANVTPQPTQETARTDAPPQDSVAEPEPASLIQPRAEEEATTQAPTVAETPAPKRPEAAETRDEPMPVKPQTPAVTVPAGKLLNIAVDAAALLNTAETDAYQRMQLRLPAGAVVSAPFAGEIVKTYLAPGTGYTLYLVSPEKGLALMIGGLRKEELIAAGTQVPASARLGLTAESDASEHLLFLQVRKLDDPAKWWQGPLQEPVPYAQAWLQIP